MQIINTRTGEAVARHVVRCESFWHRGVGLMFRWSLPDEEAYFFPGDREGIALTSIHMLFVFFPIGVIWLDRNCQVVDKKIARPFRPCYVPLRPACSFIEGTPGILERVEIGDRLEFQGL